jgi:hypothetical protein
MHACEQSSCEPCGCCGCGGSSCEPCGWVWWVTRKVPHAQVMEAVAYMHSLGIMHRWAGGRVRGRVSSGRWEILRLTCL